MALPVIDVTTTRNAPEHIGRRHPPVSLLIETGKGTGRFEASDHWEWKSVQRAMDGGDSIATIAAGLDVTKIAQGGRLNAFRDEHLTHLLEQINPDLRIRIVQQTANDPTGTLFQGYPQVQTLQWSPDDQGVSCQCISEGNEVMRTGPVAQIRGRMMLRDPWATVITPSVVKEVPSALTIFNAGNLPNRSPRYEIKRGRSETSVNLFVDDNAPGAKMWSVAEALRHLVFFYLDFADVSSADFMADTTALVGLDPSPASGDPFVRMMTAKLNNVSVASMSVEEAIHQITDAAGLHYEIQVHYKARRTSSGVRPTPAGGTTFHRLRVMATVNRGDDATSPTRKMGAAVVHDIPREPPFKDHAGRDVRAVALANRAQSANLIVDHRAVTVPIFLGGYQEFEVMLLLRPGWLPHANLDNVTSDFEDIPENQDARKRLADFAVKFWEDEFHKPAFDPTEPALGSIYDPRHPDHHTVADVGRRWIYPDDDSWVSADDPTVSDYEREYWPANLYSPYEQDAGKTNMLRNTHLGGSIGSAANWVAKRRQLLDTIGRAAKTGDTAPQLYLSFVSTDPNRALLLKRNWIPYQGARDIDLNSASITLTEPNLWTAESLIGDPGIGDLRMLRAYIEGHFMVAINCTIVGDERMMSVQSPASAALTRPRHQIIDLGFERFRFRRRRGQLSFLNVQAVDPDPQYEDRDDTVLFERAAEREARLMAGSPVAGSFEIPFIDQTYKLGDSFSGVAGLAVELATYPEVVAIEFVNSDEADMRTIIHLTDLRDSPEVGGE